MVPLFILLLPSFVLLLYFKEIQILQQFYLLNCSSSNS